MVSYRQVLSALSACAMSGLGCASLLGGLDDGTPSVTSPPDAGSDAASDAASASQACGWLTPFRYRVPFAVTHAGPAVRGYQVKLTLPTASLVAAGKMRATGADLRVTAADGVTVIPHWVEGGLGTSTTTIWTSLDLGAAGSAAYVYYGSAGAADQGSLASTFVPTVIDDPLFARTDAWSAFHEGSDDRPTSRTNEWSVTLSQGRASIYLVRPQNIDGASAGLCQTALFPAGSAYRVIFDVNITIADHATALVTRGGLRGLPIWRTRWDEIGPRWGVETADIPSGTHTICLAVASQGADVGQGAEMTYSALRVRRSVVPEPQAKQAGAEEEGCR